MGVRKKESGAKMEESGAKMEEKTESINAATTLNSTSMNMRESSST